MRGYEDMADITELKKVHLKLAEDGVIKVYHRNQYGVETSITVDAETAKSASISEEGVTWGMFFIPFEDLRINKLLYKYFAITLDSFEGMCGYDRPYPVTELIVAGAFLIAAFVLYMVWRGMLNRRLEGLREGADASKENHIFVGQLSLLDNLKLILMAQGFSEKTSEEVIFPLLKEKQIHYCAKRLMFREVGEARLIFFELQDRLRNGE